jgi:NAD(P)-dependent dehydrogenase (short-subunit alcohol dehydrogenase family)
MNSKNYLVVGGSSGIGLELVKLLDERQQTVYIGSRSVPDLTPFTNVHHFSYDASADQSELVGLPDVLDGLVYCPGSINLKPLQRLSTDDFLADFNLSLLGAVRTIKATLKRLRKSRLGASIILFSSVAVQTGMAFHASVASAKGAVEGLTRSLAAEFAPRIRVNAIAPSLTDTPMGKDLLSTDTKRDAAAERHPLKRVGTTRDIASMCVHLLADGSWITGQVIHVDGGMSSLRTFR